MPYFNDNYNKDGNVLMDGDTVKETVPMCGSLTKHTIIANLRNGLVR